MGYHDNKEYEHVELDTGVDDSTSKSKLDNIIDSINPLGVKVEVSQLLGESSLLNGGLFGQALRLLRVHLEDMKDRNELSEDMAGEIYGKLMSDTFTGSVDFLFKNEQLTISDREASAKLISSLQEVKKYDLDFEKSQIERQKIQFELNELMPIEREKMIEDVEFLHLKHLGAQIENDTLYQK